MRVGVMADSHDRIPAVAEFVRLFGQAGIGLVLHAGDFCSPFTLRPLQSSSIALAGVFGKNDGDHEGLRAEGSKGMGTELFESPHSVELAGTRILLIHDLADVHERSIAGHSLVIHGFTHEKQLKTTADTVIVNPGEACGWLYGVPSAAIVDLDTKQVEFLTLNGPEWA
jgi:hypothetical protein